MKKISILITVAMVLIFIVPAFAAKPTPEPQQTKTVISEYMEILLPDTDYVVMTVPADKKFILTDIIFSSSNSNSLSCNMYIKEDSNIKIPNLYISSSRTINLISGIPFSSGADVIVNAQGFEDPHFYIIISGYLSDL